MKKGTKLALGGVAALFGVIALAGCTQSFCSNVDVGRMLYAFDQGVTRYEAGSETLATITSGEYKIEVTNAKQVYAVYEGNEFIFSATDKLSYFNDIVSSGKSAGIRTVDGNALPYYKELDSLVLKSVLAKSLEEKVKNNAVDQASKTYTYDLSNAESYKTFERDLSYYSYLKFVSGDSGSRWDAYLLLDQQARDNVADDNKCPDSDFVRLYRGKMDSYVANYRTCLTTKTDKYGTYGYSTNGVYIEAKDWGYAWHKGFFEGLLVYPISWLVDQMAFGFRGVGVQSGAAALLAILFVTILIRALMMLATIKQTAANAKMTELQPEVAKIQNKYPHANDSNVEKEAMAREMNALYKKHGINPFASIIVMLIQFPVFICVWGALSGNAALSSGTVLGLDLSLTIREVLFNASAWTSAGNYGAVTALFLFLLMAAAQTVSMLLPQWMQKARAKKVAKTGVNPAQQSQDSKMKIFTYVMLAMIIFMGFTIVSAMGVYWFIGALVSIAQTLIMQRINDSKKRSKKK